MASCFRGVLQPGLNMLGAFKALVSQDCLLLGLDSGPPVFAFCRVWPLVMLCPQNTFIVWRYFGLVWFLAGAGARLALDMTLEDNGDVVKTRISTKTCEDRLRAL